MGNKKLPNKFTNRFSANINAYDLLGQSLLSGIQTGRLSPRMADNAIIDLGINLGKGYNASFSTNRGFPGGGPKQKFLATISKDF